MMWLWAASWEDNLWAFSDDHCHVRSHFLNWAAEKETSMVDIVKKGSEIGLSVNDTECELIAHSDQNPSNHRACRVVPVEWKTTRWSYSCPMAQRQVVMLGHHSNLPAGRIIRQWSCSWGRWQLSLLLLSRSRNMQILIVVTCSNPLQFRL